MAQSQPYNEPFFWHQIVNVGWAGGVAFVEFTHALINWQMTTTATINDGPVNDVLGSVGFNNPFSKTTGVFGAGWAAFTTVDLEDEGIAEADAFVATPAFDETIVHRIFIYSTPSAEWSDSDPTINHINDDADALVGAGNWYSIKYIGPDTSIPFVGFPEGDSIASGTTTMMWFNNETIHHDDEMGNIFRHAFIVNFAKASTVRVAITDAAPRGTTTHWTVRVYGDNGEFVQHSDGLIVPVDGRSPTRQFSGSAPDSRTGILFTFNQSGFVT